MKKISGFSFAVRHLGFLKFVPMVALGFDAWLKVWSLIMKPEVIDAMDNIDAEVSRWPGATIGLHKYGGVQFNYLGRELGHIHGNGLLDMRFTRAIKNELLTEGRIEHHHIFADSGWISFYVRSADDEAYVCKLLRMKYDKAVGVKGRT